MAADENHKQAVQHKNQETKNNNLPYDSNPFTLSFRGFGLLLEYARGVTIAIIIFGFLGLATNAIGSILDFNDYSDQNGSSQTTDSFDDYFNNTQEPYDTLADNSEGQFDYDTSQENLGNININDSNTIKEPTAMLIVVILGIVLVSLVVFIFIGTLVDAAIRGTIAAGAVAASREQYLSFGQALSAMASRFGTLWWAIILATIRIIGGMLLLIIPGIRAQLRYEALPYIIMDSPDLKAREALDKSKKLYKGHLMEMFGILTVEGIIPVIGAAIGAGGKVLSYKQIQAYASANLQTPKIHWLNYIGFILFAIFTLFIIGVVFIVLTTANFS